VMMVIKLEMNGQIGPAVVFGGDTS
jgi:hypothetical protein